MVSQYEKIINEHSVSINADSKIYTAPNIPKKKASSAIKSYARNVDIEDILLLYDDTVFGSANDGIILTHDFFMLKNRGKIQ